MKVIIHIGMHKTGSSSIQNAYSKLVSNKFHYIKHTSSNHSGRFVMLFEDEKNLPDFHGFKSRGPAFIERIPEIRERWMKDTNDDMEKSKDKTVLFSAEAISSGPKFESAVTRMRDYFYKWTDNVSVIGYVRPPKSFAESAFQQKLKGVGAKNVEPGNDWPHYFRRFDMIDRIFGRERVRLKLYSPDALFNGDVISDFSAETKLPDPNREESKLNSSLSLEATALLYAQRKFGGEFISGLQGYNHRDNSFIELLRNIGRSRLVFSEKLWAPILERYRSDVAWAEERLGTSLSEEANDQEHTISNGDDLLDIARSNIKNLEDLLIKSIPQVSKTSDERLVNTLELLRYLSYRVS